MPAFSGSMPNRPPRRAKRAVTDLSELRSIVERAQVLRVGSCDAEGPFIVPMSFGFEVSEGKGDATAVRWTFWLHSASTGRKADAWTAAPEVALELDVPAGVIEGDFSCLYSYAYESIMATGRISPVDDHAEKIHGLELLMAHMAPDASVSFFREAINHVAIWRVDVDYLTGKRREGHAFDAMAHGGPGHEGSDDLRKADVPAKKHDKHHGHDKHHKHDGKHHKNHDHAAKDDYAKDAATASAKLSKKALARAAEPALVGEHCPGCGNHCKLSNPRCGKGRKLRRRRLEQLEAASK
ncbi:pyridoxamine 5'-phosphate oxidase family protein [Thermophilibacter immobilis]|nr:pyridoxamine 5'-phosphate oxidase family protein [Thermophilibacter immobilis]